MHYKNIAYALLRVTVGVVFLFYGVGKFLAGRESVVNSMVHQFSTTFLPSVLVRAFATVLPFAETILGACLALGLLTRLTLALAAALVMALTFGVAILPNPQIVANNLIYAVILFLLLFFSDHNVIAVDKLF